MSNKTYKNKTDVKSYIDDNVIYKRIDEIRVTNININKESKRRVKIKVSGEDKLIHMIDIEYKKPNRSKKELLLIIPKQKLLEVDLNAGYIKIEINSEIEKYIKELEKHLKTLIHENSPLLFNGRNFTIEKINRGMVSNIRNIKQVNKNEYKHIKSISMSINKNTKLYEIDKNGNRILMTNFNYNKLKESNTYGDIYCKCVIKIENLQFVDNIFTYNLVMDLCELERLYNYSYVIKNGELQEGDIDSQDDDKMEDEYWDSASI